MENNNKDQNNNNFLLEKQRQEYNLIKDNYQMAVKQEQDIIMDYYQMAWCIDFAFVGIYTFCITLFAVSIEAILLNIFMMASLATLLICTLQAINSYISIKRKREITEKFVPKLESASKIQIPNQTK